MSKVTIVKVENDFYEALLRCLSDIGEKPVERGDRVLIKPNLYMPQAPEGGEITNPHLVEAVARYCLESGAGRVIIGEGPSYYQSESRLRHCFTQTGISEVADRLGIEWALFDEHEFRTFRNFSEATPNEFQVTELAFDCDKLINVPVMKTHYQTTVTLAVKNLKGCLKREDKPRFHQQKDLSRAIVDLNKIVRPALNIIDATAKTLGSVGSFMVRQPLGARLLLASTDVVAVDAVGCALMGIDPDTVPTVILATEAGLGEKDLTRIDIIGEELKRLKFQTKLPQEQLSRSFPQLEISGQERACSGCFIPLLSELRALTECNAKLKEPLRICLGDEPDTPKDRACLLIGDCAITIEDEAICVYGCAPDRAYISRRLADYFE